MRSTRNPFEEMLDEYRALTGRVGRLRDDLVSLTVTERSVDGCASVTVNAWGELVGLVFDRTLARRLDPPSLAGRVEEAARYAAAAVRRQKQALMSDLLPSGLRQLVDEDGAGLRTLLGEDAATGLFGHGPSRTPGEPR